MSRALIERSGAVPIQLEVDDSPDSGVLELLARHFPRLDVVNFENMPILTFHLIKDNHLVKILRSNSLLRSIRFLVPDNIGFDARVLPIHGEFSSRERLELNNVQASINNTRAPNLRILYLTCVYNLADLLDFLEARPLLESLELRLRRPDREALSIHRRIYWENLGTPVPFRYGLEIIRHISLPPGAGAKILRQGSPRIRLDKGTAAARPASRCGLISPCFAKAILSPSRLTACSK